MRRYSPLVLFTLPAFFVGWAVAIAAGLVPPVAPRPEPKKVLSVTEASWPIELTTNDTATADFTEEIRDPYKKMFVTTTVDLKPFAGEPMTNVFTNYIILFKVITERPKATTITTQIFHDIMPRKLSPR